MPFKMITHYIPLFLLLLIAIAILIPACSPNPNTAARVAEYNTTLSNNSSNLLSAGSPSLNPAIKNFTSLLENIGDKNYVSENTEKVYAKDAYLNDTLVTHHGSEKIKSYFLSTSDNMSSYKVTIDDIASSGKEHYVRWTMLFTAPRLNGGKPVESIGISHVRFNDYGQVIMHQDFWDSGTNIYGQIPVIGGIIESIRKRFE
jgi:hypothetical protein